MIELGGLASFLQRAAEKAWIVRCELLATASSVEWQPLQLWISLDDGSRGLAAIHQVGGISMVLTPGGSPFRGMPENAIKYDGPIDLIGSALVIAAAIREAIELKVDPLVL